MQDTRCSYITVHVTPEACLPLEGSDERLMQDGERMPWLEEGWAGNPLLQSREEGVLVREERLPFRQEGVLVREGGVLVREGGVLVREGGVLVREGGVLVREGGVLVREGGVLVREGGVLVREGGVLVREGGVLVREGGVLVREGGVLVREGGMLVREGGVLVREGGVLVREGGVLVREGGVLVREGGVLVREGGVLVREGGVLVRGPSAAVSTPLHPPSCITHPTLSLSLLLWQYKVVNQSSLQGEPSVPSSVPCGGIAEVAGWSEGLHSLQHEPCLCSQLHHPPGVVVPPSSVVSRCSPLTSVQGHLHHSLRLEESHARGKEVLEQRSVAFDVALSSSVGVIKYDGVKFRPQACELRTSC